MQAGITGRISLLGEDGTKLQEFYMLGDDDWNDDIEIRQCKVAGTMCTPP